MKICYLADANSAHTKKWCDFFKKKGYDIHVISLNDGYIKGVKVHWLNVNFEKIKSENSFNKITYIFKIFKIRRILKKVKPDIVHAHYASSYGLIGSLVNYHPYVLSIWGSDIYEFPLKGKLFQSIIKYNFKNADKILSTSKAMAEEATKYTDKKIYVTPFGVDRKLFRPIQSIKDNNEKRNDILIGTVKSLEPKYGMKYLIKAFALLKREYNNVKLEIAGDGSEKDNLEVLCKKLNLSNKDVKFLGRIDQQQVVDAFNRFDIAVFPSNSESFGVAAVEAQACGTPVVVTNVGGLPEATCPGYSSIVVNPKQTDEIYKALKKLIENKELRTKMGENGVEFIGNNFDIVDNFNYINEIYNEIKKEFNIE